MKFINQKKKKKKSDQLMNKMKKIRWLLVFPEYHTYMHDTPN